MQNNQIRNMAWRVVKLVAVFANHGIMYIVAFHPDIPIFRKYRVNQLKTCVITRESRCIGNPKTLRNRNNITNIKWIFLLDCSETEMW